MSLVKKIEHKGITISITKFPTESGKEMFGLSIVGHDGNEILSGTYRADKENMRFLKSDLRNFQKKYFGEVIDSNLLF